MPLASDRFPEGCWAGRRAFIVGGGESLEGFPFEVLKDELVVAVNRSHECGVADVVVTGDRTWVQHYRHQENLDPALPVIYIPAARSTWRPPEDVYVARCCSVGWWGNSYAEGIAPGCSGLRATNWASILGADPIYLLGIDMPEGGQRWWHGGYGRDDRAWYSDFVRAWNAAAMYHGRSTIINLNMQSRLECFQKQRWQEVLGG